jgi:GDP-L-fucose synthase
MVIPSLIHRALSGENPLVVWGDGSPIRDFIHARDVAQGMMQVMESGSTEPVNLGSGLPVSIKDVVEVIVSQMKNKPEVIWDTSKPMGDRKRLMDTSRAKKLGIEPQISLAQGIGEVMKWYETSRGIAEQRYNVFI